MSQATSAAKREVRVLALDPDRENIMDYRNSVRKPHEFWKGPVAFIYSPVDYEGVTSSVGQAYQQAKIFSKPS